MTDDSQITKRQRFDWSREEWIEVAPDDISVGTRPIPSNEQTKLWNEINQEILKPDATEATGWEVKIVDGPKFWFEDKAAAIDAYEIAEYTLGRMALIYRADDPEENTSELRK